MSSFFSVSITGQIEGVYIPGHDDLYCKYSLMNGPDWTILAGIEEGVTQLAKGAPCSVFSASTDTNRATIWNFPLECAWKSTNVYGWPQVIFNVYGIDGLGRDVVRGYGCARIPRAPGSHVVYVPLFTPKASTPFNQFLSWATGKLPEFLDSRFIAKNHGREAARVVSKGMLKVQIQVVLKDMEKFGYGVLPSLSAVYSKP